MRARELDRLLHLLLLIRPSRSARLRGNRTRRSRAVVFTPLWVAFPFVVLPALDERAGVSARNPDDAQAGAGRGWWDLPLALQVPVQLGVTLWAVRRAGARGLLFFMAHGRFSVPPWQTSRAPRTENRDGCTRARWMRA